jgi:carbon storage regulator
VIVIPRKIGESVVIGDDIILTVVEIRGDKVRLGAEVPREVAIRRKEVYEALRQKEIKEGMWPVLRLDAGR